jgi:hypothetical protein
MHRPPAQIHVKARTLSAQLSRGTRGTAVLRVLRHSGCWEYSRTQEPKSRVKGDRKLEIAKATGVSLQDINWTFRQCGLIL